MNNPNHEVIDLVTPPPSPPVVVNLVTPPPTPDVSDDERASSVGASSGGASSGGASSGGASSGGTSEIKFGSGPCGSSNKDNLSVEHFSFRTGSKQERAESLRFSFGISPNISDPEEIRTRVNSVMSDVCTDIGPVYLNGAVDWALDRKDPFEFDFLTSVKLGDEFVGFMTVKDDLPNSCQVTLLCARRGCGGYVYDHAEVEARRRGNNKIELDSVMDKYGFYRKKGFTSRNNKLDVFWDDISVVDGIPDDDGSENFFIRYYGRNRKLSGIWPTIKTYTNASEKNSVSANLIRSFSRGKLVNIVRLKFGGDAKAFFDGIPDVEVNASGTLSMEKNI